MKFSINEGSSLDVEIGDRVEESKGTYTEVNV
jgi:hypothetical protein